MKALNQNHNSPDRNPCCASARPRLSCCRARGVGLLRTPAPVATTQATLDTMAMAADLPRLPPRPMRRPTSPIVSMPATSCASWFTARQASQYLCGRCRRLHHHAADRRGPCRGPPGPARRRRHRPPQARLSARASCCCRGRDYRPFFILGEVTAPGQYPYVPNLTVESAVAIAGGFTPRAQRSGIRLTRTGEAGVMQAVVPPGTLLRPGDTIVVGERWF